MRAALTGASGLLGANLAAALDSPNGPLRDNVQRLIVHRADKAAVPTLAKLAEQCTRPECRMQALCTLDGLNALKPDQMRMALADVHPGVRAQSVRLAERWLPADPATGAALVALVGDADIRVRYQLALSLGEWDDARAGEALGRLGIADGHNGRRFPRHAGIHEP